MLKAHGNQHFLSHPFLTTPLNRCSIMGSKEVEWRNIVESIKSCNACILHKNRKNAVPGEGSLNATVMFIGEAPGRREDETGRPFVGAAGKLLDELLSRAGLRRAEVFITNVVKCRPPNNRDPREEEVSECSVHTNKIIKLIAPKIIVTLGNHSGRYVFEKLAGMEWYGVSRARGRVYEATILELKVKVIPTYHPAAALYNPKLRTRLENDFDTIGKELKKLEGGPPENITEGRKTILDYLKGG